nr:hypothetical protein [uncultured Actinoplanes sp.]
MLLKLNRQTTDHAFTATATDLPINPAGLPDSRGPLPVVAVLGHGGRVAGLPQHLPAGWSMRAATGLDDVRPDELVLFAGATVGQIVAARAVLPHRTLIVALVDGQTPGEVVAGVLTAGADVCVRGGQPAILAGHLVAGRRRLVASRWEQLDRQRPA